MKAEAIQEVRMLKYNSFKFWSQCPARKHIKHTHKSGEHGRTSHVLELLHMDLMGPMQVESLGGKKYVLVVVDEVFQIYLG